MISFRNVWSRVVKRAVITLTYFENHFTLVSRIEQGDHDAIRSIRGKQLFLWITSHHIFYLYLRGSSIGLWEQLAQFDWARLQGMPAIMHLWTGLFTLISIYFYQLLYFDTVKNRAIVTIKNILGKKSQFFQRFQDNLPGMSGVNPVKLKQVALTTLNYYQCVYFLLDVYFAFMHVLFLSRIYNSSLWNSWLGAIVVLPGEHLNGLLFYIAVRRQVKLCILYVVLNILNTFIIFFKLKQITVFLTSRLSKPVGGVWAWFYPLRHHYQESLQLIIAADRVYGPPIVLFIVVNVPFNAYFMMMLSVKSMNVANFMFLLVMTFQVTSINFFFHLVAALYTRRLHRPVKTLISLYLREKRFYAFHRPTRMHLRFSLLIEALHTRNRYGITYNNAGLITLQSFFKFLMFFVKFLIVSYKLLTVDAH